MSLLLLYAAVSLYTPPSPSFDPGRNWFTLEAPNFSIHFSCPGRLTQEAADLALEVAAICEEVRRTVGDSTGVFPPEPVQVVIADFHDYANGWAIPFPYPTITITPTPPAGSRTNDDNWLRTLILHEYSHVLQLTQVQGFGLALRRRFGSVVLPNALLPSWLVEGYAVYNETRFSSFGRLRSAEHEMMLRAAADAGRLLPVDRCDGYELQRWPGGNAPYLYGSRFLGHIAGKTRPDIWDEFNRRHARLLPFCEDAAARAVFGRRLGPLWREWQQAAAVEPEPASALDQLTHEGLHTGSPCWSRSGAELYYVSASGRERTAIKALNLGTLDTRVLHRGAVSGPLALSPDGRTLAFSEYRLVRNGALLSDIFALDLTSGAVHPLTNGRRARDPDFAPDTALLVFVANRNGQNDLVLLDLSSGEERPLTETGDRTGYSCPRFSPGGRWIATSVSRPGGFTDIELIDRSSGWSVAVTHDRATDLSPAWSRTGRTLFFVSDRSGRFDLYAYSVEAGRLYRCARARYGLFAPAVSPDNRSIAVIAHSADGDDIALTLLDVGGWEPAPEFDDTLPSREFGTAAIESGLFYYRPFPTVMPRFWLPWLARAPGWEVGASTFGWDVLQYHTYSLAAGWNFADATPFLTGTYLWTRFRPSVEVSARGAFNRQQAALNFSLPFPAIDHNHWLDLGPLLVRDTLTALSLQASWLLSSARSYHFCVTPVQGTVVGVSADASTRSLLNPRDRTRVAAHATHYVGLPPATWSLRCRAALGLAAGDLSRNAAFSLSNQAGLFRVRGYSEPGEPAAGVALTGVQFRAPLWWPERGIGLLPVFLRNLNAALFGEAGAAWTRFDPGRLGSAARVGVGAELRADLLLFRYVPVQATVGCGIGVTRGLTSQWYARLESEMLSTLVSRNPAVWPRPGKAPEPD